MKNKVLVSGIQSSGQIHIGNYFGAIKQNIELSNSGEFLSYLFIADYHSMTSLYNKDERKQYTFEVACTYLACGLDTEKTVLFKQSDIPLVHELTWVLNTITPMPLLMLAHAFKDKEAKNADVNVGLFDYPVLMASDILMYGAHIVPVGKDQAQHIEITRDIAGKYNRAYGELFEMPEAYIRADVATVPGVDGTKMSKSKNNHIPIFATPEEIHKRVMSIVTDSARPEDKKDVETNVIYQIHSIFLDDAEKAELKKKFEVGGLGYKDAKEMCAKTIIEYFAPMREKYEYYKSNPHIVEQILRVGGERAKVRAEETMKSVRLATGLE